MCQNDYPTDEKISTWDEKEKCYPRKNPEWILKVPCKEINEALSFKKMIYDAVGVLPEMVYIKQNKFKE